MSIKFTSRAWRHEAIVPMGCSPHAFSSPLSRPSDSTTTGIKVGLAGASPYHAPGRARLLPSRDQSSGRANVMTQLNSARALTRTGGMATGS